MRLSILSFAMVLLLVCSSCVKNAAKDINARFYAKVIDQNGDPVANAKVKYNISFFNPLAPLKSNMLVFEDHKNFETTTDNEGEFKIHKRCRSIGIKNVEIIGYEFNLPHPSRKTSFGVIVKDGKKVFMHSSPDDPAIITIRKRGSLEHLYRRSYFGGRVYPDKETRFRFSALEERWDDEWGIPQEYKPAYNFDEDEKRQYWHKRNERYRLQKKGLELPPDLKDFNPRLGEGDIEVWGKLSEDRKDYVLGLTFLGKNGGILLNDELVYEAPAEGYKPEVIITIPSGQSIDVKRYLYIKGEDGKTYSRLTAVIRVKPRSMMAVHFTMFTNPAGSTHLEYDPAAISAEKKRRRVLNERFNKMTNDMLSKYYVDKKAGKKPVKPDKDSIKEAFKEMIKQERQAAKNKGRNGL